MLSKNIYLLLSQFPEMIVFVWSCSSLVTELITHRSSVVMTSQKSFSSFEVITWQHHMHITSSHHVFQDHCPVLNSSFVQNFRFTLFLMFKHTLKKSNFLLQPIHFCFHKCYGLFLSQNYKNPEHPWTVFTDVRDFCNFGWKANLFLKGWDLSNNIFLK